MNLQSQVVSLELAKRLKEIGVVQESHFWWFKVNPNAEWKLGGAFSSMAEGNISALTVAELGEILPEYVSYSKLDNVWFTEADNIPGEEREDFTNRCFTDESEADSRAKMLIYLLENNLTPSPEPNQ